MRYVAFLRAINVGGNNMVQMPVLRDLFETLGFTEVKTYIQTGNVLFTSPAKDSDKLERMLEQELTAALGIKSEVFVRTRAQLVTTEKRNPFEPAKHDHKQHTHVMWLSATPAQTRQDELLAKAGDQYRFAVKGSVLYYAYSRELGGNRKTIPIEKILGVTGTSRTWKVINKLIEMLDPE